MSTLEYLKNKYDLDLSQTSPIEIEGVGRLDLLRWFRELNFKTGVEIGVDRGEYSKLICETNTQIKLYGVDSWLKYPEYHEYHDQAELDSIYEDMKFKLRNYIAEGQYIPIRKKSMDALADFADESLDFVYIDANHEANYPLDDITGWAKKVRIGGIVSGHDYVRVKTLDFTIKDALEKYTKDNNISPWFILGSFKKHTGTVRDRTRSWLFIK
jgi:hypothetical protein